MRLIVLALLTGCVSSQRQQQASAQSSLGAAYLREGNAPAAVGVLREAVRLDSRNFEAWEKLALAYMAQGVLDESEVAFKKAIRLAPERAEIHNNYGLLLMERQRRDEAIAQFEIALSDITYRSPALVLNNLGYALYNEGRNDEALHHLSNAIKRAPELCPAYFNRGLVHRAKDLPQLALADFDAVIQRCPADAMGSYYQAGGVLLELDDTYGGCSYLRIVVDGAPTSPLAAQAREVLARECSTW
ncbi:MAG: Tfp pilus assembly protein PilF [Myxococcota bacterium]|jgi:Tfp pilus assembly protein PilF